MESWTSLAKDGLEKGVQLVWYLGAVGLVVVDVVVLLLPKEVQGVLVEVHGMGDGLLLDRLKGRYFEGLWLLHLACLMIRVLGLLVLHQL